MRRLTLFTTVLAVLLGMAGQSWAQTATGQITGTVKDGSGAVMAGAKVKISSEKMGFTRETVTSDTGDYVFPLLPVGVYSISAEQVLGLPAFGVAARSATWPRRGAGRANLSIGPTGPTLCSDCTARKVRDSNSWYGVTAHWFSRPAPSAARTTFPN